MSATFQKLIRNKSNRASRLHLITLTDIFSKYICRHSPINYKMRSTKIIHIVSCHAEGEVGDVIVGGVNPPPGGSIWEQSRWIEQDQTLRRFVLNEPRGGVFKHVNLLVPPKSEKADFGFIIMEPEHTPPMSGANSICVATVLLDSGMIQMKVPETSFYLEAPAGLLQV